MPHYCTDVISPELLQDVRPITDDEVATFERDGVVHLIGVLNPALVAAMSEPLEAVLASPEVADLGAMVGGTGPTFVAGTDHFRTRPDFAAFACRSPLPAIAAALLRSQSVWLVEDSVLVKEPGSPHRTQFHTDLGYFHLRGAQLCTTWVPLDATGPASGMVQYLPGSHRLSHDYRPNHFVDPTPLPDTVGEVVPDILADPALAGALITVEALPGDVVIHHARTIHGGPANSSTTRRRAISVRYGGDDVRHLRKPGVPVSRWQQAAVDGTPLADPDWPLVHSARPPRAARASDLSG